MACLRAATMSFASVVSYCAYHIVRGSAKIGFEHSLMASTSETSRLVNRATFLCLYTQSLNLNSNWLDWFWCHSPSRSTLHIVPSLLEEASLLTTSTEQYYGLEVIFGTKWIHTILPVPMVFSWWFTKIPGDCHLWGRVNWTTWLDSQHADFHISVGQNHAPCSAQVVVRHMGDSEAVCKPF